MRFGLAVFGAVLIGGISVGLGVLGGSNDSTKSSQLHVRRAVAAGTPVSQSTRAPVRRVPAVQVALAGLTPAGPRHEARRQARNTHVQQGGGVTRRERSGLRTDIQGSALSPAQRPKDQMPAPIQNFDGVELQCGCLPPDTEGDVGPEPLHAVGQPPVRDLQRDGHAGDAGHARDTSSWPAERLRHPVAGQRRRPDRRLRPVRGPLGRVPVRVPELSRSGPYYQCVAVSSTDDPTGTWCALPVSSPCRRSSTTIRSSGSGRPRTPTWSRSTSSPSPATAGPASASSRSSATR